MKNKIFFIALFAMMIFAVQGYAQRSERGGGGERSRPRVERSTSNNRGRSSYRSSNSSRRENNYAYTRSQNSQTRGNSQVQRPQRRENQNRQTTVRTQPQRRENVRNNNSQPRRENVRRTSPQTRRENVRSHHDARRGNPHYSRPVAHHNHGHRPHFGHHHSYHHHHHHCLFDNWYWYTWGSYHNRFICHRHYHNRFFDSLLGYYIWGSIDTPNRIDIGNMSFTRYNSSLRINIGGRYTYLNLYQYNNLTYTIGYTYVEVTTSNGYATIYFSDEYGNTAIYRL